MRSCAVLAIAMLSSAAVRADIAYRLTDLGPGVATGINNSGQVLGSTIDVISHNFLYATQTGRALLPDGFQAIALNDTGLIAGAFVFSAGSQIHAAVFNPARGLTDLRAGSPDASYAYGINNAGQVAGSELTDAWRAFRYTPGLGSVTLGTGFNEARAINNKGDITGYSASGAFIDGLSAPFRSIGLANSIGLAINDHGQVVGDASGSAFLYTPGTGIATLATAHFPNYAFGINNGGQVVGEYAVGNGQSRAFLYSASAGVIDLNTRVASATAAGWTLTSARDINDGGQIVGLGMLGGENRAFLLTPVPEPATWMLMLGGLGLLASSARLRRATS
jgi:probable HAF family extracellular repeat protein